jgi:DNA polymerase/3'-5' exonuclease PolX
MRLLARKKGYSLSDHGIKPAEHRKNNLSWKGQNILCQTEEDVFKLLNIPYKKPEERNIN